MMKCGCENVFGGFVGRMNREEDEQERIGREREREVVFLVLNFFKLLVRFERIVIRVDLTVLFSF